MKKVNTRMYANDNKIGAAYVIFLLLFIFTVMWANIDCSEDYRTIEREWKRNDGLYSGNVVHASSYGDIHRYGDSSNLRSYRSDTLFEEDNGVDSEEQIQEEIEAGEIEMLAQLIQAEAGNQDFKGMCLVADVVMNRVRSETFPNSVEEVIFQYLTDKYGDKHYQFSTIIDGSFDEAGWEMSDNAFKAAYQEYYASAKTGHLPYDDRILYFTAGGYNPYCKPMYKYGDHYFGR